jgi:hypothetical protein
VLIRLVDASARHLHLVREISVGSEIRKRRTQVPSGEVPKGTLGGMLKDLELALNVHEFREKCRSVGCAV